MEQVAENLWVLRYPQRLLGVAIGRTVTIIRLTSGKLVVHSSAPFSPEEVSAIGNRGVPGWLVDVSLFHDSFARDGSAAFPHLPYLAPEGFSKVSGVETEQLSSPPAEWRTELQVLELAGMPKVREHAMFHTPSRTLIVADLLFNFGDGESAWTRFFARHVMRLNKLVGMSPFFRMMIRDRDAFRQSLDAIMAWDFDRVIVGHGEIIETGGKQCIREVASAFGVQPPTH